MSCQPDISVIVPAYNSAATLRRAVESVLHQRTDAQVQIVIADDGSTDSTVALAEEIAAVHPGIIRVLKADRNRGLVDNYFAALAQCRGRYITDCAPDDHWLGTEALDAKFRMLEERPDAVAVYSPWVETHPDGTNCTRSGMGCDIPADSALTHQFMVRLLRRDRPAAMHLSTVLYRADIIREALKRRPDVICNPLFGFEDMPVMLALAARGTILYCPEPSLAYSVGQPSISNAADAAPRAIFAARASLACRRLALYYGIPLRLIRDSLRHHLTYALGQARHSARRDVKREVAKAVEQCRIPLGVRGRILKILNL